MSLPAFYLPAGDWQGRCSLTGDEYRHLQVLRVRQGEKILLLDGKGRSALCRVLANHRHESELEILSVIETPEPQTRPIIAIALSKAARRGFFLEKAAELGAWEIWLWEAQRSQGRIESRLVQTCAAQLRAGAKQCHNPWFPEIRTTGNAKQLAENSQTCQWRYLPWEIRAGEPVIGLEQLGRPGTSVYAIGPEGGLTEEEANSLIEAGFDPVSLGSRVLRCETAAVLCLGLHWWAFQFKKEAE